MPMMGEATSTASHGNVGSDSGRQRENASLLARHIDTSSPQPPSLDKPTAVMMKEPSRMMTAWGVAVFMMARMPPKAV